MDELPELRVETWWQAVPPPAVPVPARHCAELNRERAIAAVPDVGLLHDMRVFGNSRRDRDGVEHVDLVPELDYWRTRLTPGSAVTPRRFPLDQVFIEHRLEAVLDADGQAQPHTHSPGDAAALLRRVAAGPEQPGARTPAPARTVTHLHGRRIIQVTPSGFGWDLRAVSEPYEDTGGEIRLALTSAHDYYRWLVTGQQPEITPIPLYVLWTE